VSGNSGKSFLSNYDKTSRVLTSVYITNTGLDDAVKQTSGAEVSVLNGNNVLQREDEITWVSDNLVISMLGARADSQLVLDYLLRYPSTLTGGSSESGSTPQSTIECGEDFDCFIDASRTCSLANVVHTMGVNFFGIITSSTAQLQIRGTEFDKCIYYQETESITVEYSEEMITQLLETNTLEEIREMEEEANELAQENVGATSLCIFDQTYLTDMLIRWKQGTYSSEDLEGCDSSG